MGGVEASKGLHSVRIIKALELAIAVCVLAVLTYSNFHWVK